MTSAALQTAASSLRTAWILGTAAAAVFLLYSPPSVSAQTPTSEPHDHAAHQDQGAHEDHGAHQDGAHDHSAHSEDAHHGHGKGLHHDFSDAERWAAIFDDPNRATWQRPEDVVRLMRIADDAHVADLGAGTGFFLPYLAAATPDGKVYGLDPEANLVHHMEQRVAAAGLEQVEIRQIGFDSPGLDAASVDRILIVNTWHHISDREIYARKLLESLRPGGRLFVVDYTMDSPTGPPVRHRLPPEDVIAELTAGGFTAETLAEELPRQYIVVGSRPE